MQFPSAPHPKMSDRYVLVDTNKVVANMAELGYQVADVRGPKYRTVNGPYGFHMVDFRLQNAMTPGQSSESPRVLFINSYDGSARAQVVAGIIRWICSNGLIAGNIVARERVMHIGDEARSLIERVSKIAAESEKVLDRIAKAKTLRLSKSQQNEFTLRAVGLMRENPDPVASLAFNQPRRAEDLSPDMWTTFNRVQENLVRGGIPVQSANGSLILTRELRNVQRSVKLNRELWDLMEEFSEEVAA